TPPGRPSLRILATVVRRRDRRRPRRCRERYGEEERRTPAELAVGPDPATVRFDDATCDRESESGPLVAPRRARPVALEQVRVIRERDAGPFVRHREHHLVLALLDAELHRAT